jgi:hypothetical protein
MTLTTDIRDVDFCLRKAVEFRAKAEETDHRKLKSAFEAVARQYDLRAKENATRISASYAVEYRRDRNLAFSNNCRKSPK